MVQDFADDRHRPRYHFLPHANWMNDPNGLIQYRGRYHLFYQYNPNGAFWGTMHWGHAISQDLVHWEHMPVALAPDPDGPDADGCYSGAAVVHEGVPTLIYTGVRGDAQLACVATSGDDDLATWTKHSSNPVISAPPAGLPVTMFRDHTLWREGNAWMMGVGAGIEEKGGAVLLYRSDDLADWEYLWPFVTEDASLNPEGRLVSTGWECPDFYFLEDQPVLVACDWDGAAISVSYWTGTYDEGRFSPTFRGAVDAGACFYAPQSFRSDSGARIMFGWLREMRPVEAQVAAGWSGVMSLPRQVTMRPDGDVAFSVSPEVENLRARRLDADVLDGEVQLAGIPGDALEINATFERVSDLPVRMHVRCSADSEERTTIEWNPVDGELTLDTRNSSVATDVSGDLARCALELASGEKLALRVFVDRSVVEVYANDRVVNSGRVYPAREDSTGVRIEPAGALMASPRVYEMGPAIG